MRRVFDMGVGLCVGGVLCVCVGGGRVSEREWGGGEEWVNQ